MCAMRIKLNFKGMETLFAELPSPEKQAIHLLVSGNVKENKIAKLTAELVSIIAFLCQKLNWIEEVEDLDDDKDRKLISKERESNERILIDKNVSYDVKDQENEIKTPTASNAGLQYPAEATGAALSGKTTSFAG